MSSEGRGPGSASAGVALSLSLPLGIRVSEETLLHTEAEKAVVVVDELGLGIHIIPYLENVTRLGQVFKSVKLANGRVVVGVRSLESLQKASRILRNGGFVISFELLDMLIQNLGTLHRVHEIRPLLAHVQCQVTNSAHLVAAVFEELWEGRKATDGAVALAVAHGIPVPFCDGRLVLPSAIDVDANGLEHVEERFLHLFTLSLLTLGQVQVAIETVEEAWDSERYVGDASEVLHESAVLVEKELQSHRLGLDHSSHDGSVEATLPHVQVDRLPADAVLIAVVELVPAKPIGHLARLEVRLQVQRSNLGKACNLSALVDREDDVENVQDIAEADEGTVIHTDCDNFWQVAKDDSQSRLVKKRNLAEVENPNRIAASVELLDYRGCSVSKSAAASHHFGVGTYSGLQRTWR